MGWSQDNAGCGRMEGDAEVRAGAWGNSGGSSSQRNATCWVSWIAHGVGWQMDKNVRATDRIPKQLRRLSS